MEAPCEKEVVKGLGDHSREEILITGVKRNSLLLPETLL